MARAVDTHDRRRGGRAVRKQVGEERRGGRFGGAGDGRCEVEPHLSMGRKGSCE